MYLSMYTYLEYIQSYCMVFVIKTRWYGLYAHDGTSLCNISYKIICSKLFSSSAHFFLFFHEQSRRTGFFQSCDLMIVLLLLFFVGSSIVQQYFC